MRPQRSNLPESPTCSCRPGPAQHRPLVAAPWSRGSPAEGISECDLYGARPRLRVRLTPRSPSNTGPCWGHRLPPRGLGVLSLKDMICCTGCTYLFLGTVVNLASLGMACRNMCSMSEVLDFGGLCACDPLPGQRRHIVGLPFWKGLY